MRLRWRPTYGWIALVVGVTVVLLCLVTVTLLTLTNHSQGKTNGRLADNNAVALQQIRHDDAIHHAQTVKKDNEILVLTKEVKMLQMQYLAEQAGLVAAGKEQEAFAAWLVQTNASICLATDAPCPPLPTFGPLP